MANSETGDGQAAGGGRNRSRSKTRPTVDPNAADKGADGDSTETLKKSVAELQTQFLQVAELQTQFLQVQQQLQAVSNCEGESLVLQWLNHCNTLVMSCITSDDFQYM